MLSDENLGWGNKCPGTLGGSPVKMCLMVENADTVVARAAEAGAIVDMEPCDMFYGFRNGVITDPAGHKWMVQHKIEDVSPEEMQRRWETMSKDPGGCGTSEA
jgi:uncharacterized glyoxalase superfamily protein PhnB